MKKLASDAWFDVKTIVLPVVVVAAIVLGWPPIVKVSFILAFWASVLTPWSEFKGSVGRWKRRAARLRARIARRWRRRGHLPGTASRQTRM